MVRGDDEQMPTRRPSTSTKPVPATVVAVCISCISCVSVLAAACGSKQQATSPGTTGVASAPRASVPATTAPPQPSGGSWPTYMHDSSRSGFDPAPPIGTVRQDWAASLPGTAYAEPLVAQGRVIVATEDDSVTAFDGTTGKVQWSTKLGRPMAGSQLPCGNIDPSGITSTPVVDTTTATVWVVAFLAPGHHRLFGLSLADGAITSSITADPPGSNALAQQQRGALTLSGGEVYVPFGGLYGDCGDYHGYLAAFGGRPVSLQHTFDATPGSRQGAVWAPPGATVDARGDLFLTTGNGASTGAFDGGNAVFRLSPSLAVQDTFAPSNFAALNASDADLGSTGPTLAGTDLVFQIGKSGVGYLLRADHLGGIGGQAFSQQVCQGAYGANATVPAGTSGSPATVVLVPCVDGLYALSVGPGSSFHRLWSDPAVSPGPPVVIGGTVWVQDPDKGIVVALDPRTGALLSQTNVGHATRWATPAAGSSDLYVAADTRLVALSGV